MKTLITQGQVKFGDTGFFPCPVRIIFDGSQNPTVEYENVLDTGKKIWCRPAADVSVKVPMILAAAVGLAA